MIKEAFFKSSCDDLEISYLSLVPDGEIKGVIQLVHGMAEHKERYMDLMQYLADNGYASYINDHRGHGKSVKDIDDLGYFYDENGDYIVEDIYELTKIIKQNHQDVPNYLFGHSMGSMVVRKYAAKYDDKIDKLIVCGSPSKNAMINLALTLVNIVGTFKGDNHRSKLIDKLAFFGYDKRFDGDLKNKWLSLNLDNVKEYNEDPLCGFIFTINGFKNLFSLMRDAYDKNKYQVKNPELKILFIAGEDDPVIISTDKFNEAVNFMRDLGYKDVSSILYPKMRHEILNDMKAKDVYHDILNFIER